MSTEPRTTRRGGQVKGDLFLVMTESTRQENGTWVHAPCGTTIETAVVHHSIHDGVGLLSGFGEVHRQVTPYCPQCESKPLTTGAPISGR